MIVGIWLGILVVFAGAFGIALLFGAFVVRYCFDATGEEFAEQASSLAQHQPAKTAEIREEDFLHSLQYLPVSNSDGRESASVFDAPA